MLKDKLEEFSLLNLMCVLTATNDDVKKDWYLSVQIFINNFSFSVDST